MVNWIHYCHSWGTNCITSEVHAALNDVNGIITYHTIRKNGGNRLKSNFYCSPWCWGIFPCDWFRLRGGEMKIGIVYCFWHYYSITLVAGELHWQAVALAQNKMALSGCDTPTSFWYGQNASMEMLASSRDQRWQRTARLLHDNSS